MAESRLSGAYGTTYFKDEKYDAIVQYEKTWQPGNVLVHPNPIVKNRFVEQRDKMMKNWTSKGKTRTPLVSPLKYTSRPTSNMAEIHIGGHVRLQPQNQEFKLYNIHDVIYSPEAALKCTSSVLQSASQDVINGNNKYGQISVNDKKDVGIRLIEGELRAIKQFNEISAVHTSSAVLKYIYENLENGEISKDILDTLISLGEIKKKFADIIVSDKISKQKKKEVVKQMLQDQMLREGKLQTFANKNSALIVRNENCINSTHGKASNHLISDNFDDRLDSQQSSHANAKRQMLQTKLAPIVEVKRSNVHLFQDDIFPVPEDVNPNETCDHFEDTEDLDHCINKRIKSGESAKYTMKVFNTKFQPRREFSNSPDKNRNFISTIDFPSSHLTDPESPLFHQVSDICYQEGSCTSKPIGNTNVSNLGLSQSLKSDKDKTSWLEFHDKKTYNNKDRTCKRKMAAAQKAQQMIEALSEKYGHTIESDSFAINIKQLQRSSEQTHCKLSKHKIYEDSSDGHISSLVSQNVSEYGRNTRKPNEKKKMRT